MIMTVKEMYDKFAEIITEGKGDYDVVLPPFESGWEDIVDVMDNFHQVHVDSHIEYKG